MATCSTSASTSSCEVGGDWHLMGASPLTLQQQQPPLQSQSQQAIGLLSSMDIDAATVAGTLTLVNEEASRSRTAMLRAGRAAVAEELGLGSRGAVQSAGRPSPGLDRQPTCRSGRGLHVSTDRAAGPFAADGLASSPRFEGSRPDRGRPQARNLDGLPTRS